MYTLRVGSQSHLVGTLKLWLNDLVTPSPNLPAGNSFDITTRDAVIRFQLVHQLNPDGRVGPHTWGVMGKEVGSRMWFLSTIHELPTWLRSIALGKNTTTAMAFDPKVFFGMYMEEFGLSPTQSSGLKALLQKIELDREITDVRWVAYMLATVKHECANTWMPIEEIGKGAGKAYGVPVTVTGDDGKQYKNTYYGRGYVQLTWKDNYENLGQSLGLGKTLLIHPEKALEPEIAYKIMSYGMRNGSFSGHKLSDYIDGPSCDYKNARKIINGLDQWQLIKGYADKLETMLRASL